MKEITAQIHIPPEYDLDSVLEQMAEVMPPGSAFAYNYTDENDEITMVLLTQEVTT